MSVSAIALVLYNVFIYSVASDIKGNVEDARDTQYSLSDVIVTVGKWIAPEHALMNWIMDETSSEFGDMFWTINAGVNALLLVPAIVQHRGVRTWIVPMVFICNLFVLQRLLAYCLVTALTLWHQQMHDSVLKLIVCGLGMSSLHIALICRSIKFSVVE